MLEYQVGTVFLSSGRHPRLCTVTDILRTYNNMGKLVSVRYVAQHKFLGQIVTDKDVLATTIARGIVALKASQWGAPIPHIE